MIDIYKFDELGNHNYGWLDAHYHFNFANYYNPNIKTKNPLVVWNDDTIKSQTGFPMHSHQNMEIITYIRKGSITHKDNLGNSGEINAGQIQVMSAGTGITHSEYNLSNKDTLLFQIWIEPNIANITPRWKNIDLKKIKNKDFIILASGEEKYINLNVLKINQDASVILLNNSLSNSLSYNLGNSRHAYFVLSKGELLIDNKKVKQRDGVYISGLNKVDIKFLKDSEIILVDLPLNE